MTLSLTTILVQEEETHRQNIAVLGMPNQSQCLCQYSHIINSSSLTCVCVQQ